MVIGSKSVMQAPVNFWQQEQVIEVLDPFTKLFKAINFKCEKTELMTPLLAEQLQLILSQNSMPNDIEPYKNLPKPIELCLSGNAITDEKLRWLIGVPIRELLLHNCSNLTTASLSIIKDMKGLQVLRLSKCKWVDNHVLDNIPASVQILELSMNPNFNGFGLSKLKETIHTLILQNCHQLTDSDMIQLPCHFKRLELNFCNRFSQSVFMHIGKMDQLLHLSLDDLENKEALSHLPQQLISLYLADCSLDDSAFELLSKMKNLQELKLSSPNLKGENLSLLSGLKNLCLSGCKKLSDQTLMPLASSPYLKTLNVLRCPNISAISINAFAQTNIAINSG